MDEEKIFIEARESGERIDALLAFEFDDLTRNAAQRLLDSGKVSLVKPDGHLIEIKKSYRTSQGEVFSVLLPEPEETSLIPQDIPLDIAYEDQSVIVVNKQRGLVVHPAPGHPDGTLVNALLYHCGSELSGIGGERRPGIVHRIDKDTSGLLIVAKNDNAHQKLSLQLADRSLSRTYHAIVNGNFKEYEGTINKPIGRHPADRKKMAVTEKNSRTAVTHWTVLESYNGYSYVKCKLETGRTHQIRVHMASIGHPLLGDGLYGAKCPDKGLEGQCLHAAELRFIHPDTGKMVELATPDPEYFTAVKSKLGNKK